MKSSPNFFIVPGFKMKATDKGFSWLVSDLKKRGFNVIPVPINWGYRVMSDYINDFKQYYQKHKSKVNYVLGFSYGAVITFSSASELMPDKIFLCSLSSDFKEDTSVMKPWVQKLIGKRRLRDANTRSGRSLAKALKVPSVVFYGEEEIKGYPQLRIRCEETASLAKNSKLVIVPNAPHKIDNPEYIKAIQNQLESL